MIIKVKNKEVLIMVTPVETIHFQIEMPHELFGTEIQHVTLDVNPGASKINLCRQIAQAVQTMGNFSDTETLASQITLLHDKIAIGSAECPSINALHHIPRHTDAGRSIRDPIHIIICR
jgi:hypothetical protein